MTRRKCARQALLYRATPSVQAFCTERLNVFVLSLRPQPREAPRLVFLGCYRRIDCPTLVVTATVNIHCDPAWVDWIETSATARRSGYARELWQGIESYLGVKLDSLGVTPEGAAFMAAVMQRTKRVAQVGCR